MVEAIEKIALLVLAAYNPLNLQWLAETLTEDFVLYVHIDKKEDENKFSAIGNISKVRFIQERVDVFWAGFSMIEATVKLMEAAFSDSASRISHLCLISDDTFPLFSPETLALRLRSSKNDWIETWEVPETHLFQERYRRFYYLDSKFSTPRWHHTEDRNFKEIDYANLVALMEMKKRGKVKLKNLYSGKQWWVLTRNTASELLRFHRSQRYFVDSFRYSAVTDEIYFQTIYKILFANTEKFSNPMLDDFSRDPKPFVFTEANEILRAAGPVVESSRYLFLRKVKIQQREEYLHLCNLIWR